MSSHFLAVISPSSIISPIVKGRKKTKDATIPAINATRTGVIQYLALNKRKYIVAGRRRWENSAAGR